MNVFDTCRFTKCEKKWLNVALTGLSLGAGDPGTFHIDPIVTL